MMRNQLGFHQRALELIDLNDMRQVGGKAMGLARLIQCGFPVPPGFCVTASAFQSNADAEAIRDVKERSGNSRALRDAPDAENCHSLEPRIAAQILYSYRRLGAGKVAIRSSASFEDGELVSFAGQQQTFLGVEGDQPVCDAVIRCWESLFAHRAQAYRLHQGFGATDCGMAVIVQRMVDADVAGVVFTRDPVEPENSCRPTEGPTSGENPRIIVEASWGLGDSVVSGKVTPDRWTIDRHDRRILNRQIATKSSQSTLYGVCEVPADRRNQPCLSDDQLCQLALLALNVEHLMQYPCDIEWAWADGKFWLLQARPITTFACLDRDLLVSEEVAVLRSIAESTGTVWVRQSLAEVLPAPTPLTWSIIRRLMCGRGGFGLVYSDLGLSPDPSLDHDGVFDLVFGRPYCNLSREPKLYSRILPLEHPFLELKANPEKAFSSTPALNPLRMDAKVWFEFGISIPGMIVKSVATEFRRRSQMPKFEKWFLEEFVPPFERNAKAALNEDLSCIDPSKIWQRCERWQQRTLVEFARESLKPTSLASMAAKRIERLLTPRVGADSAGLAVRKLMMHVAPHSVSDLSQGLGDYAAGKLTLDEFMSRFGHRGGNEMELSEPRWYERPNTETISHASDRTDADSASSGAESDFLEQTLTKIVEESKLPNRLAIRIRRDALEMRTMLRLRETAKHFFMMGYAVIRKSLCALDRWFQLDGGIFYLTVDEISGFVKPQLGPHDAAAKVCAQPVDESILKLIATRRIRRRELLKVEVPAVLFSDELHLIGRITESAATTTFQGTPLSTGIAEGPALVLDAPVEKAPFDGFVLICPSTDPAWVPLFTLAKALVMESGGVLSHGAIVAREFGLPAVAGLPGILRMIHTGDWVRVNGNSGLVQI